MFKSLFHLHIAVLKKVNLDKFAKKEITICKVTISDSSKSIVIYAI